MCPVQNPYGLWAVNPDYGLGSCPAIHCRRLRTARLSAFKEQNKGLWCKRSGGDYHGGNALERFVSC